MAYTPGVARVCNAIAAEPDRVHDLTIKKNTVAIVTDGTAVLGLGDIGPEAALPVMEGKALLFKEFAGVDAFPICLDVPRPTRSSRPSSASPRVRRHQPRGHRRPRVLRGRGAPAGAARHPGVPRRPARHRGRHARRPGERPQVVDKKMDDLKVVIAGVGAAGVAISKILMEAGVGHIIGVDRKGAI